MTDRVTLIEKCLRDAFDLQDVQIIDDSAAHRGHPGAQSGGGHFNVTVVSRVFNGKTPLQRHRQVYAALHDLMPQEIHALSIKAVTPDEI
jgi:BolA protein